MLINFYERYQPVNQLKFIENALFSENLTTDGKYAGLLREYFHRVCGIQNILFTTSATTSLELAVQLLDLQPGDEVIIPSFNFPSAANAVLKCGGVPILCDVEKNTPYIDLENAAARITTRTKAVIPTHYAGISCDMNKLMDLARINNIKVIEDAAQSVHSLYNHAPLGTIGDFGAYSFHYTKNFSCGEGGAFICKDNNFTERAEIIRDNGTNKAQFLRSEVSCYSWKAKGSNYMFNEACAALLYAQLLESKKIILKRKAVAEIYNSMLKQSLEQLDSKITLMNVPQYSKPNYHIYYVNCVNSENRDKLQKALISEGIDVRTHFIPLHVSTLGKSMGYQLFDLPNSIAVSQTILRLPIHTEMTQNDAEFTADILIKRVKEL